MRKNNLRKHISGVLFIFFLAAASICAQNTANGNLVKYLLTKNGYTILLPGNYQLVLEDPLSDFVVYYVNFGTTTLGGIYFGNFPNYHNKTKTNKIKNEQSVLFEREYNWEIFNLNGQYFAEIIVDNVKNDGWDKKMHLWILCKTLKDMENMLFYYSTLEKM